MLTKPILTPLPPVCQQKLPRRVSGVVVFIGRISYLSVCDERYLRIIFDLSGRMYAPNNPGKKNDLSGGTKELNNKSRTTQ